MMELSYQDAIGEALLRKKERSGEPVSFLFYKGRRIPILRGGMPIADNLPARIADWAGVGTTYYVDSATGSNSNTETQAKNPATPWQTLAHFKANYVKPATGHVRCLIKGTHRATGTATGVQATLELWGLGARAPDSTHILIFEAWDTNAIPLIQEPAYTGSTPEAAERHAIWLDDATASFTRFRNLEIVQNTASTNQQQGFRIDSNVADVDISKCKIHGWKSAATSGVDRSQGIFCDGSRLHLYDNEIYDNGDAATEAAGASHAIYFAGAAANCVVVQNILRDNRNGFGLQFFASGSGGSGHIVAHNIMSNNLMSGMVVDGPGWIVTAYNNIIYDNDEWAITVRNAAVVTARYNLTNANTNAGTLGDGYNVGTGGGTFTVSNRIISAPSFVNYAGKNFHLNSGSPAYNVGDITYTPLLDREGGSRVVSTLGPYIAPEETSIQTKAGGIGTGGSKVGGGRLAQFSKTGPARSGSATLGASRGFNVPRTGGVKAVGKFGGTGREKPPPTIVDLPVIGGYPLLGATVTATTGVWANTPNTFAYQWLRADHSDFLGAVEIAGATSPEYVITTADVGKFLRCRVRATN